MSLYDNIIDILKGLGIKYQEINHEESHSCEQSKKFRDEAGLDGLGSKNIVFHAKGRFYILTTYGDKQIKARNFKHEFGTKDIRFASQDEIFDEISGKIGSIPPFGFENETIPVFVDAEIFDSEFFMFNPGNPEKSIRISTDDLKEIYSKMKNPIRYFIHSEEDFRILEDLSSR
ncbi:MAG: YbaK/EbsC family protein [Candidatus Gracilibacteria bacterium]|nr:YbaK/EbsC family protein [Candidatus Gracilibacteria bacterium]